jgi:hypothetical protein
VEVNKEDENVEEQVEGKDGSPSSQCRREMLPRKVKDPSLYVARTVVKDAEDDGSAYEVDEEDDEEDDEEEPEEDVKRSRKKRARLATAAAASPSFPVNDGTLGNFPPFHSLDLAIAAAASTSLPVNNGNSGNFPSFHSLDGGGEEVSNNMP